MAQFLDKQGLTTYSNLIKGELDALDARIEALETGGKYMPVTGGTFTGDIGVRTLAGKATLTGNSLSFSKAGKITGLNNPTQDNEAANKAYVDSKAGGAPTYIQAASVGIFGRGSVASLRSTDSTGSVLADDKLLYFGVGTPEEAEVLSLPIMVANPNASTCYLGLFATGSFRPIASVYTLNGTITITPYSGSGPSATITLAASETVTVIGIAEK